MMIFVSVLAFIVAMREPESSNDSIKTSWGRPNVSLAQYRRDAAECGRLGYDTDISNVDATKKFVHAHNVILRNLDEAGAEYTVPNNVRLFRPNDQIDKVGEYLQSTVDRCLTERGYARFWLTKQQSESLSKKEKGSNERRSYMHKLASDPVVLSHQNIVE